MFKFISDASLIIASKFGAIFTIGATTDELQVRASKAHTMTEAHIADLEVLILVSERALLYS